MQVTFKLYASLQKLLPAGSQGHAINVNVHEKTTLQQLIEQLGISDDLAFLVMLNGVYIAPEHRNSTYLNEHDVVAIWPKVAGG